MAQRNPSKFVTDREVDDPLQQGSRFQFDADDRQYIDNQIRGIQEYLVDEAIPAIEDGLGGGDELPDPTGHAGDALVVNATADGYELADVVDIPALAGNGGKIVAVNAGATALEYVRRGDRIPITFADANIDATGAPHNLTRDRIAGAIISVDGTNATTVRDLTIPRPADDTEAYVFTLEMSVGTNGVRVIHAGGNWTFAAATGGATHLLMVRNGAVTALGPAGTPAQMGVQYVQSSGYMGAVPMGTALHVFRVNAAGNGYEFAAAAAGGSSFADDVFEVTDDADATKILKFQCSGITTGTTRTLTAPNASGTIALIDLAQTFSARQIFSAGIDVGAGTVASTGDIRLGASGVIAFDRTGSNILGLWMDTGTSLGVGNANATAVSIYSGGPIVFGPAGVGTQARFGLPIMGDEAGNGATRFDVTSITKSDTSDLTLTAAQYSRMQIEINGVPGGGFALIAPAQAGAVFCIVNNTASICTVKKSGGSGVAIAADSTAWIRYSTAATDYKRSTADVVH